ncbi:MAG TPA: phosphoribosyltransferase family protein [Methanomassiliicoccales archaeon]
MKDRFGAIRHRIYYSDKFQLPRTVLHKIHYGSPRFVSNVEMAGFVDEWVKTFDVQYDLIVGVPRSGLLIGCIIATKLAKPLATPDGSLWMSKSIHIRPIRKVLVVDDCITTGKSINEAAERIRAKYPGAEVRTGALFANDKNKEMVDSYYTIINGYQLFQWNMMHYKLGPVGFDLDGVICESTPKVSSEDRYLEFLTKARPYLIPEFEIDYIITSRPEKYRPQTENWLKENRVKFKNLIMWNVQKEPSDVESAASFKSKMITESQIFYYMESSIKQAELIWGATRVPCLCIDEMRIID